MRFIGGLVHELGVGRGLVGWRHHVAEDEQVEGAEEGAAELIRSGGGAADVEKYVLGVQQTIVKHLLSGFDSRIQDPGIAHLLGSMFDFRDMPLEESPAAHEKLVVHGDAAADEVCEVYFPELDAECVKDQMLAVKLYVRENIEQFMFRVDEKDPTKGSAMRICGKGSVMEALFTRKSIGSKPIPDFLHIADYMISFMWQSCCGERAGSHINAVKTKGRTLLGDDTFNDAIWLTYNLPPLHLVDYGRFVRAWKKEGTQRMGIFKGAETGTADDPNSASQVVRRHLSATSPSPLYQ